MKLCFLLMWAAEGGGTNRAIYTQANELAKRHRVSVLSVVRRTDGMFYDVARSIRIRHLVDATRGQPRLTDGARADIGGPPSQLIDPDIEPGFSRHTDVAVEQALRKLDADVLVTTTPPLLHLATKFVPDTVAIVHQEHRTSEERNDRLRTMLLEAAPATRAVVVLTEPTANWLRGSLGGAAPRVEVIGNAIPDGYRPLSSLDSKTVVSAGRLVRAKQMHHLIDAFAAVVAERPDWQLRIFGDGPQLETLRRRVRRAGLSNHVALPGLTPSMEREWAKASIAALASRREGFPLVMPEAMAAGVPFVSYDSPNGPAAIITHELDGLLTPVDDIPDLSSALLRLVNDDEERRRMGAAARASATRFGAAPLAARWERLYADLIGVPVKRRPFVPAIRRFRG